MINVNKLEGIIKETYGLPFKSSSARVEEGYLVTLEPVGIAYTIGFSIKVLIGWRSLEVSFVLAKFAAELVQKMGSASNDQKKIFSSFVQTILQNDASFSMKINSDEQDPLNYYSWPAQWKHLFIKLRKDAIVFEDNYVVNDNIVIPWCIRFVGAAVSLLPTESAIDEGHHDEEGERCETTSKRYERSLLNRALCIELHGACCKVCSISFAEYYGDIGKGFIHVHHIEPLALMSEPKELNPFTDLIPVCPNCHSMLHKKSPPYTVEELKGSIESTKM